MDEGTEKNHVRKKKKNKQAQENAWKVSHTFMIQQIVDAVQSSEEQHRRPPGHNSAILYVIRDTRLKTATFMFWPEKKRLHFKTRSIRTRWPIGFQI